VGFDPSSLDRSIDPCVNFYQFACGGWQKANPRPADQGSWGSFDVLQERNRIVLHNILESVSSARSGRTAIEQKIGDYFAACMMRRPSTRRDRGAEGRSGPDRGDPQQTRRHRRSDPLYKIGAPPFFRFASEPDPKNSTTIIANVDQGGLGLPDRDYYFRDDAKSVDLRKKYIVHLQKIVELLGAPQRKPQKRRSGDEDRDHLAKGSLDRVARRDPNNIYHKLTTAELISLAPGFDWQKFFDATGSPKFDSLDVSCRRSCGDGIGDRRA
jgi:endothelin-converting enzyme/putative endopeptidase